MEIHDVSLALKEAQTVFDRPVMNTNWLKPIKSMFIGD